MAAVAQTKDGNMDMLNIESGPDLKQWIDHRLDEGRYVDAAEYLRDLIRRDMAVNGDSGIDRITQSECL
jgi:Arc/MetJ-type ribon-helix-helix transcriptional regulator